MNYLTYRNKNILLYSVSSLKNISHSINYQLDSFKLFNL
jgi:hypothetical protein